MSDTDPDVERRYREMLMRLTPERRVRMTSDMWDTATELSLATIDARTEFEIRVALFLRRYGHEFDEAERARIVAHLRRRGCGSRSGEPTAERARMGA